MEKLKECPACGTTDTLGLWHKREGECRDGGVACECGYATTVGVVGNGVDLAAVSVEQWNRRASSWVSVEERLPEVNGPCIAFDGVRVMYPHDDGEWVRYADYAALLSELAAERQKTKRLEESRKKGKRMLRAIWRRLNKTREREEYQEERAENAMSAFECSQMDLNEAGAEIEELQADRDRLAAEVERLKGKHRCNWRETGHGFRVCTICGEQSI